MKVSIIEERQKIESIQEQIANDEVPTHDSAYSSRQTTASPTPIPQPSPRKVKEIKTNVLSFYPPKSCLRILISYLEL